ncbi:hypothetical protein GCM10010977_06540 [Citricoccus zhacaiensis]|uniref:DUF3263 domain-containing protein n=1 Tax=Citricoccus zhacaiensis TaxID=489142 RepID=A0ABQ2LQY0_9MICC|nr:DUF3263 domain-containing protein [Citricoccus zhacaiensis]GGO41893.1 hypothetical protein GCM10010977_06540 [Citricoccus zhacaiensis]
MTAANAAEPDGAPTLAEGAVEPAVDALSERDRDILDFEDQWWKYGGAKDQAIRDRFSLSATTYYQVLNGLLDRQEALAHKPMLVKRLRRLRTTRHRARSARRQEA